VIVAVGIDLVELWRIRRALERFPGRFAERVFHPEELLSLDGRADPVPGLAARFAAKEAFQKCWSEPFGWRDVWVVKEGARPSLRLTPKLEEACRAEGLVPHLSLTHGRDHAAAVVVLERQVRVSDHAPFE